MKKKIIWVYFPLNISLFAALYETVYVHESISRVLENPRLVGLKGNSENTWYIRRVLIGLAGTKFAYASKLPLKKHGCNKKY